MVVKNYKVLCELLEQETKTGKSRQLQMKEFSRYFEWKKSGQKFIITDIYETPLEKVDNRKYGNNSGHYRRKDNYNYNVNYKYNQKNRCV